MNCYLCGVSNATKPANLKETFNGHVFAKSPESDCLCDKCDFAINCRAWYWNAARVDPKSKQIGMWVLLYARGWSWLESDSESWPKFSKPEEHWPQEPNSGKEKFRASWPVVSELPTRAQLRQWLIDPPSPPFKIAVSETGQKHIYFLAEPAHSRDYFPIVFEEDRLVIERKRFAAFLFQFERLIELGFSKTQILTSDYHGNQLVKAGVSKEFQQLESAIAALRGKRILELIAHVAGAKPGEAEALLAED